jgi:hypothetical protein
MFSFHVPFMYQITKNCGKNTWDDTVIHIVMCTVSQLQVVSTVLLMHNHFFQELIQDIFCSMILMHNHLVCKCD